MSFSRLEENNKDVVSWMDQVDILQSEIVMLRLYIRKKDFSSAKARIKSLNRRTVYMMEEYA